MFAIIFTTSYILSHCDLEFVHRCAGPVANMTFRRKVSATFIFIFISIWFLYNIIVITNGGSEGEGIRKCLYINSSLSAVLHVLLLSSWSSGSTFLSKLLSHYPGVFLSFEPLVLVSSKGTTQH